MTKDILVRVRGVQTIGEEEDTVEMITPGTYYVKNGKQYLIYDESLDETGTPTHNTVKVMENRIEVMKRGLVESHMIFEPGRRTTANYRTPMGLFLMGITTSLLEVEEDEEAILLRIKYSTGSMHSTAVQKFWHHRKRMKCWEFQYREKT